MLKNLKKKYFAHSFVSILVIIGIIILINIIATEIFHRFDITAEKNYSLSQTSVNTLKNIKEKVTINVYFSEKLPPEYLNVRQSVQDLLNEYKTYGTGNLEIKYQDPSQDDTLKKDLKVKGIPELQFNIMEKDQFQLTNGYLGITINYLDKEEVIPVVQDTKSFEYDLTSAIKKVTSDQTYKIAWAKNKGDETADFAALSQGKSTSTKYSQVITELKKDFNIAEIDLSTGELLDSNTYKTLVIAGVEEEVDDKTRYVIDQFIMKGGSVLFLLDGVKVDQNMQVTPIKNGLDDLLANYGAVIKKSFVLDSSNETASFQGGYMTFMVPYPYWVKVTKDGFDKNNAAVSNLESVVMPWVSSVESANGQALIKSSSKSWLSPETNIDLDPQQDFKADSYGQNNLGVTIIGALNSFYKDKDKPQDVATESFTDKTDNGRLAIIGDADFAADNFVAQYNENFVFLANMLDWLNQDESLIAIRSKSNTDRVLNQLTDSQKTSLKYGNIFGITAIVIILGAIRVVMRKKRLKKIKFKL